MTNFLSGNELELMRTHAENLSLAGTAVIWRESNTQDSYGVPISGTAIVGTVSCYLAKNDRTILEEERFERELDENFYLLSVAWDADIQESDYVTIDGQDYAVRTFWDSHNYRVFKRARVTLLDDDD